MSDVVNVGSGRAVVEETMFSKSGSAVRYATPAIFNPAVLLVAVCLLHLNRTKCDRVLDSFNETAIFGSMQSSRIETSGGRESKD